MKITDQRLLETIEGREISSERLETMTPEELFNEYCVWTFGDNWGPVLLNIYEDCKKGLKK